VAADKPEGEFLGQFVGRLRVAQGAEQVAVDGLAVAAQQLVLGGGGLGGGAVVGLADDRPVGLDAAEPRVGGFVLHDAPPEAAGRAGARRAASGLYRGAAAHSISPRRRPAVPFRRQRHAAYSVIPW